MPDRPFKISILAVNANCNIRISPEKHIICPNCQSSLFIDSISSGTDLFVVCAKCNRNFIIFSTISSIDFPGNNQN